MTQSFDDLKAELLRDPAVRAEYDARAEEFEIASELIAARLRAGPVTRATRSSNGHFAIGRRPHRIRATLAEPGNAATLRQSDRGAAGGAAGAVRG